jgi:hypothetical protein
MQRSFGGCFKKVVTSAILPICCSLLLLVAAGAVRFGGHRIAGLSGTYVAQVRLQMILQRMIM